MILVYAMVSLILNAHGVYNLPK